MYTIENLSDCEFLLVIANGLCNKYKKYIQNIKYHTVCNVAAWLCGKKVLVSKSGKLLFIFHTCAIPMNALYVDTKNIS